MNLDGQNQVSVKRFEKVTATAIERVGDGVPTSFAMEPNYPNPFNPTTKIRFTLNESGFANLSVYDVYGHRVRTLVSKTLSAGTYSTTFSAEGLASGNYFYNLDFNGQRVSGTMTLMK